MGCCLPKKVEAEAWSGRLEDKIEIRHTQNSIEIKSPKQDLSFENQRHSPVRAQTQSLLATSRDSENALEDDDKDDNFEDSDQDEPPDESFTMLQLMKYIESNQLDINIQNREKADILADIRKTWAKTEGGQSQPTVAKEDDWSKAPGVVNCSEEAEVKAHESWFDIRTLRVQHLDTPPAEPEPFFEFPENSAQISADILSDIVRLTPKARVVYYSPADATEAAKGTFVYTLSSKTDTTLLFDARFESGNLQQALQLSPFSYKLVLRNDWGSPQPRRMWYYFCISNTRSRQSYILTIFDGFRARQAYVKGCRPLAYSYKKAAAKKIGWFRAGTDISFYKSSSLSASLTFTYEADFD